jgi:hypothetical protein
MDHLSGIGHQFSIKSDEVDGKIEIVNSNDNIIDDSLRFLGGFISQLQDN